MDTCNTDITALIKSCTELKSYFEKVRDDIESERKALADEFRKKTELMEQRVAEKQEPILAHLARLDKEQQPICGTWFYGGPQEGSIEITGGNNIVRWLSEIESTNADASCFNWSPGQSYISIKKSGQYLIAVNVSLANIPDIAVMAELVQKKEGSAEKRIGYSIIHSHGGDGGEIKGYATGSFTVVKKIEENAEIALKIFLRTPGKTIRLHDGTFISIIRLEP